jgi:hypothetical protein
LESEPVKASLAFALCLLASPVVVRAGAVTVDPMDPTNWFHIQLSENPVTAIDWKLMRPGHFVGDPNVGTLDLRPNMELWMRRVETFFIVWDPAIEKLLVLRPEPEERMLSSLTVELGARNMAVTPPRQAVTFNGTRTISSPLRAPEPAAGVMLALGALAIVRRRRPR